MVVTHAAREFDHRKFSEQDRARVAQPPDDRRVVVELLILVRYRAPSGRRVVCGEQVFDATRDAMQRAAIMSTFEFALGRARFLERALTHDGHNCAET